MFATDCWFGSSGDAYSSQCAADGKRAKRERLPAADARPNGRHFRSRATRQARTATIAMCRQRATLTCPCRANLVQTVYEGATRRRIAPLADGATSAPMPGAAGSRPRRGLSVSGPIAGLGPPAGLGWRVGPPAIPSR
jgi:hypothetical protein